MALVRNIKEKVHLPIYDCIRVAPGDQLRKDHGSSSTLKFFSDVQGKTKLETNLQSASLLPHYNTFEARAMRVVISDLPPIFGDADVDLQGNPTRDGEDEIRIDPATGNVLAPAVPPALPGGVPLTATVQVPLDEVQELLRRARASDDGSVTVDLPEDVADWDVGETQLNPGQNVNVAGVNAVADGTFVMTVDDLELAIQELEERDRPPDLQVRPNDGAGTLIGKLVYNTVTSLYVGEKLMIEMPTWFFPSGAGPYSEGKVTTHGEPSPTSTFRFAESVFIEKQQNFRVEIEVPDSEVWKELQRLYGPLFIWVVLDGYMTRDVQ